MTGPIDEPLRWHIGFIKTILPRVVLKEGADDLDLFLIDKISEGPFFSSNMTLVHRNNALFNSVT
jgi:hypothetical protein